MRARKQYHEGTSFCPAAGVHSQSLPKPLDFPQTFTVYSELTGSFFLLFLQAIQSATTPTPTFARGEGLPGCEGAGPALQAALLHLLHLLQVARSAPALQL